MRVVWLVAVLLVSACGSNGPSGTVTYRVSGVSHASSITFEMEAGTSQRTDQPLPWSQTRSADDGDFLYVSAQNSDNSGCISVSISVGNETIAQNQSCGRFAIATASATR